MKIATFATGLCNSIARLNKSITQSVNKSILFLLLAAASQAAFAKTIYVKTDVSNLGVPATLAAPPAGSTSTPYPNGTVLEWNEKRGEGELSHYRGRTQITLAEVKRTSRGFVVRKFNEDFDVVATTTHATKEEAFAKIKKIATAYKG